MPTVDCGARTGAGARRPAAVIVACAALAIAGCVPQESKDKIRSAADAAAAAKKRNNTKFTPAGDEGLGASLAILLDNSGSMKQEAPGDLKPKYVVARDAIEAMLASTDSFVARQSGFPVNVGLYVFSGSVLRAVPIQTYNRTMLRNALASLDLPNGGTAIGKAMDVAVGDLYRAGTIRKYILVVTDGENTEGRSPRAVAKEIERRSGGAVRMYFVAFDIAARTFAFVRDVNGEVLGASNGIALRASLDTIYRGRILAEAVNAGETLPSTKKSP